MTSEPLIWIDEKSPLPDTEIEKLSEHIKVPSPLLFVDVIEDPGDSSFAETPAISTLAESIAPEYPFPKG